MPSCIFIHALPFSNLQILLKRAIRGIPAQLITVGDHLRKKRLELHLLQKDVAKKFGVSEDTITNWENNRHSPQGKLMLKAIQFIDNNL